MRHLALFALRGRSALCGGAGCLGQVHAVAIVALLGLAIWGCGARTAASEPSRAAETEERAGAAIEGSGARADGSDGVATSNIAALHRRKCGNCHTRVEPGSLPRATIEAAMARHRRRAKLTEGQWTELIEFLSRSAPFERHHTASLPKAAP